MVRTIYMKIRALMGSQAHDTSEPITGLLEEAFDDRRAIVLFLRHNRVFKKRTFTEPGEIINTLMGYQKKSREPVFLVPMEILWGKQPVKVQRSLLDIMLGDKEAPRLHPAGPHAAPLLTSLHRDHGSRHEPEGLST